MKILDSRKENLLNQEVFIGSTEYDTIVLVGSQDNKIVADTLNFSGSGNFTALLIGDKEKIDSDYKLAAKFNSWLKIYDDDGPVLEIWASEIKIYKDDAVGCIIQLINYPILA